MGMSDIEIGSKWVNRCDGSEVTVVRVGSQCVQFSTVFEGKKWLHSHTVADFKKYYNPLVGADMVNHPPHYKDASGIECIEVTSKMQFCGGNCFKYLYRAGKKGSTVEDLKKAAWYANKAWEQAEIVSIVPMRLIKKVAEHREGNIKDAMLYVAEDFWAMAALFIKKEIDRLESSK